MKFQESQHAHRLLDGLTGLEVGGSAHNDYGLNTVNVDWTGEMTGYKQGEVDLCGEFMPVDIVAWAWEIPVEDKSYDFVLASHVIEHILDPIAALKEWARIARRYIYLVIPQRNATLKDANQELTSLGEIIERTMGPSQSQELGHVNRWTSTSFVEICSYFGFHVMEVLDPDDKVGNGFTVVIDVQKSILK